MSAWIQCEQLEGGITRLRINRPEAANALSQELLEALADKLQSIKEDGNTHVVILTAAGNRMFSAGADLKERAGMNEEEVIAAVAHIKETVNAVASLPQPVIGALNGSALGGGLELALACDIRIGAHESKYGLPETSLAIIPGAGGTQRLARLIGPGNAKNLIYTAEMLTGEQAHGLGLLEFCTSIERVEEEALAFAKKLGKNGPLALRQAKRAIDDGLETNIQAGLEIETKAYQKTVPTNDRLEGIRAFKEKRSPVYKGE
ncbi:enoyl-CoA hydratase/carnithine racemase [Geomicrobium halophilum]|uniref:Enoyl-CoA hydratase/carnithine racemase n=1 Tax=Geomicrobium halophilum TaxID=549000 RepID=A0A841PLC9_9BACL|nr:enoyl-CoA hydratase-related protein [Geomicrobium halophilum]MBB6449559.1 enoyl-CoA hydratase/carnithine racemase [Geomicrobium halophilum]